jgi:cytochrome c biogenesis protein CcmG, thiol:disulfide interchange protein DsbE
VNDALKRSEIVQSNKKMSLGWGRIIVWVSLTALLALLFFGLLNSQKKALKLGDKAPSFELTTFQGQTISSEDLIGKVVVLNIWASWCVPCEQEAADLESAWRYYEPRGDVTFLGVAWTDTDKKSFEYLKRNEISYPNGPDLGTRIFQAFRATGVPETYVIDRSGILRFIKISPFESLAEIQTVVNSVLEE